MFGRRAAPKRPLDGMVTFSGSYHAMRAESVLRKAGFEVRLVPGPRAISPNCGVALRFDHAKRAEVEAALAGGSVQVEALHHYPEK